MKYPSRSIILSSRLTFLDPFFSDAPKFRQIETLCLNYKTEEFSEDEISEFIDFANLAFSDEVLNSMRNHERQGIVKKQFPPVILDISYLGVLETLLKELFIKDIENCASLPAYYDFGELGNNVEAVKTVGFLSPMLDINQKPIRLTSSSQHNSFEFCLAELKANWQNLEVEQSKIGSIPCLLRIPIGYDKEINKIRISHYGIPALIIGKWINAEGFPNTHSDEFKLKDNLLLIYATFLLPETERQSQVFGKDNLREIIWKSKLHISENFPSNKWREDIQKLHSDIWSQMVGCNDISELCACLTRLNDRKQVLSLSSAYVQDPVDGWQSSNINLPSLLAIFCNILQRISWHLQSEWLNKVVLNLVLFRRKNSVLWDNEGDCIGLDISHNGTQYVWIGTDASDTSDLIQIERLTYSLLKPYHKNAPLDNQLYKYYYEKWPQNTEINPLSSLAIVSVGRLSEYVKNDLKYSVSGIIELEDRHVRISNLPEPWQYNLLKALDIIAANPNIRYLVVLGAVKNTPVSVKCLQLCADMMDSSDEYPKELENLPEVYFPKHLITNAINQLKKVEIYAGDPEDIFNLHMFAQEMIISSYIATEVGERISECNCFFDYQDMSDNGVEGSITFDKHLPSHLSSGVIGETVRIVYPDVVRAVLSFGEKTTALDRSGRTYKELSSFRISVIDPYQGTSVLGFDEDALEKHFQHEWKNKGGRFLERMTLSFRLPNGETIDQLSNIVANIAQDVLDEKVTRRLIISVYHPVLDRNDILSLNTIHFNISRSSSSPSLWLLHSSIVMRTIDVLFGLPYDIFAACRFTTYVAQLVNEIVSPSKQVRAKNVNIVALNLHLYYDALNLKIAHRIAMSD